MTEFGTTRRPGQRMMRPILGAALASFLLGGALVGYIAYSVDRDAPRPANTASAERASAPRQIVSTSPSPTPSPVASEAARAVEEVQEQQGGIDQRLAAAEQRIARIELRAEAASGNAARAEGLLVAFAARRALEKGAELGFLADQLRLRFGDALPNAVDTVIAASRDPVTKDQLIARLDRLSQHLVNPTDQSGFERFREELSQLFVIRRETAPSPQPARRLERARLFIESGRVESAIAEVRNLPGAENAADWIRDAKRYAAAQKALGLIETSAVLEPRRLRDGQGNRIMQPGLAGE